MKSGKVTFKKFKSLSFSISEFDDIEPILETLDLDERSYILKRQTEFILPDKLEPNEIKIGSFELPIFITITMTFRHEKDFTAFQILR
jgi:hypothetical protein